MSLPIPNTPKQTSTIKRSVINILNLLSFISLIPIGFLALLFATVSTDSGTSIGIVPTLGVGVLLGVAILAGIYLSQRKSSYVWAIAAALPGALLVGFFLYGLEPPIR